jgi:hypothetical protein
MEAIPPHFPQFLCLIATWECQCAQCAQCAQCNKKPKCIIYLFMASLTMLYLGLHSVECLNTERKINLKSTGKEAVVAHSRQCLNLQQNCQPAEAMPLLSFERATPQL